MPVCFFVEIALEKVIEINERNCSGEEKQILLDEQHIEGVLNSILEVYLELPFEAIDQLCQSSTVLVAEIDLLAYDI